jgi:hypothetical protein
MAEIQQEQSPSHLGSVAGRHGGEEANQTTGSSNNNLMMVLGQHLPSPAANAVRGGNGVVIPASPETANRPVTDSLHDESVMDNYRWLEKQRGPRHGRGSRHRTPIRMLTWTR